MTRLFTIHPIVLTGIILMMLCLMGILLILYIVYDKKVQTSKDMKALDDVIAFNVFNDFIKYQLKSANEPFTLLSVCIDYFEHMTHFLSDAHVHTYLKRIEKRLQVNLTLGSKLTQSLDKKEMFIIYIPCVYPQEVLEKICEKLGNTIKKAVILTQDISIVNTASIASINTDQEACQNKDLIHAMREKIYLTQKAGGQKVMIQNENIHIKQGAIIQMDTLTHMLKTHQMTTHFSEIYDTQTHQIYAVELYAKLKRKKTRIVSFRDVLCELDVYDNAFWFELWLIEHTFYMYKKQYDAYENQPRFMVIPIFEQHLVHEVFLDKLNECIKKHDVDSSQIMLKMIVSIDALKSYDVFDTVERFHSLGFRIGVELDNILDFNYQILNEHHIRHVMIKKQHFMNASTPKVDIEAFLLHIQVYHMDLMISDVSGDIEMQFFNEKKIYFIKKPTIDKTKISYHQFKEEKEKEKQNQKKALEVYA